MGRLRPRLVAGPLLFFLALTFGLDDDPLPAFHGTAPSMRAQCYYSMKPHRAYDRAIAESFPAHTRRNHPLCLRSGGRR